MLVKYPASLSLTAYSYSFATLFMLGTGVFATGGLHEWILTPPEIIAIIYAVRSVLTYLGFQSYLLRNKVSINLADKFS